MTHNIMSVRQTTIKQDAVLNGIGVHSGSPVTLLLSPSDPDTGIQFIITKNGAPIAELQATSEVVKNVTLCTIIGDEYGAIAATVEHLISAIRGLGIDNITIEMESGEVPIMDGSAAPFVDVLLESGIKEQTAPRRYIKVLKTVRVEEDGAFAEFRPHDGFHLDVTIDFESELIGKQSIALEVTPSSYAADLARARTFGFMSDVEKLWAAGRALGASLENTIALGEDKILNPEGLRYTDEFVRHKAMDAVGDLALAGAPLLASYKSVCGGHSLNFKAVETLLGDKSAWTYVEAPRSRQYAHAEMGDGLVAANFAAIKN
ncbi:MAG: UDP-3-O-acyl-N-acetylglucosamine deacetylase [Hyphomicrobiaceae bacterium]|nr:UDP-3-O-acyl-N-acetylglucosamine deacetylase [Hyphomicrobiaceae bacterium]